jgi:glycosyltransferase involved in cell wall biosynthesis
MSMWRLYRLQRRRLRLLAGYRVLLTHSEHLKREYRRYGLGADKITYYAEAGASPVAPPALPEAPPVWRLLFLGRFSRLKGGRILLDALATAHALLHHPVHLTFAGDGECRTEWEARAAAVQARCPGVTVEFSGWVSTSARDALLAQTHLMVVPSLWPEPFGRIGPEAGSAGVPVVAFDVGGVRDWLTDGENGVLAPGDPPTADGLGQTIGRALAEVAAYNHLRARAPALASRFTMANHLAELRGVLDRAARPEATAAFSR